MAVKEVFCGLAQTLWMGACLEEACRFKKASRSDLHNVQGNVLREIVKNSCNTEYGKKYGFSGIGSINDFKKAVPVNDYDDLEPFINNIAEGHQNVLTEDKILMFEETSGTSAGSRLIPYTSSLQNAFNRALHPWLFNLHSNISGLWGGPAYWVVTPKVKDRLTPGGIRIGFASDSDYFGSWAKPLIKALTVVDETAAIGADPESWRYYSILELLRSDNLRLISLWNPGFFLALIRSMSDWRDQLLYDLEKGGCSRSSVFTEFESMPGRAQIFKKALNALDEGNNSSFGKLLWPKMALISAWQEAGASSTAEILKDFFPGVYYQTKGLLATEGAVTLPVFGAPAAVLAARSAFFEFEEGEEGAGDLRLADELETGARYRVIMTTFGGLFRYRLHDIVEVKGWWHNLPALAFVGKEAMVSDLCGEKLNSAHLNSVVKRLLKNTPAAFFAPEVPTNTPPFYMLFTATPSIIADQQNLSEQLESMLCENIHYRWARQAGQLAPVKFVKLTVTDSELELLWLKRLEELKKPVSTAKFGVLSRLDGWHEWFLQQLNGRPAPCR